MTVLSVLILYALDLCRVVEKDLYLSREYKTELERRLDCQLAGLRLPLVFLHGSLLGVGRYYLLLCVFMKD